MNGSEGAHHPLDVPYAVRPSSMMRKIARTAWIMVMIPIDMATAFCCALGVGSKLVRGEMGAPEARALQDSGRG